MGKPGECFFLTKKASRENGSLSFRPGGGLKAVHPPDLIVGENISSGPLRRGRTFLKKAWVAQLVRAPVL